MAKILIVEDNRRFSDDIKYFIEKGGHNCDQVYNKEDAEKIITSDSFNYDLVILDVNLENSSPDVTVNDRNDSSGFELIGKIDSTVPIIFSSSHTEDSFIDRGYHLGAVEYMRKGYKPEELVAKINVFLNLTGKNKTEASLENKSSVSDIQGNDILDYDGVVINKKDWSVTCDNNPVNLTRAELGIFEVLMRNKGRYLTNIEILDQAWGDRADKVYPEVVKGHISRMRGKFDLIGKKYLIKTREGGHSQYGIGVQ